MTAVAVENHEATVTYNGWSTRETWVVNLWLGGNEGYYYHLRHIISHFPTPSEQAEEIEAFVRFLVEELEPGLKSDLLSAALGRVEWQEIADANR